MYQLIELDRIGEDGSDFPSRPFCKWCKKCCGSFNDLLSIREYTISLLCQGCQDLVFESRYSKGALDKYFSTINTIREKGEKK